MKPACPRLRLRLAVTLACLLAGPLLLELQMRWLLFGEGERARRYGAELRQAARFASPRDSDYWKLDWRFSGGREAPLRGFDPRIGWVGTAIEPRTYRHADEALVGARRPVLLFGASYAACVTRDADCFQGLLERSELGAELRLLNYGVAGHGLDQALMLLREVLPRHAAARPLVIVAPVLDDDLHRCALGFRQRPKPRFELAGGELVHAGAIDAEGSEAWLARHPPRITSYAWRLFVHGGGLLPGSLRARLVGKARARAEERRLVRAILHAIVDELEAHGVPGLFLLFKEYRPRASAQRALRYLDLVVEVLDARGVPWRTTWDELEREATAEGREAGTYFVAGGAAKGHPSAETNGLLFGVLEAGLREMLTSGAPPR